MYKVEPKDPTSRVLFFVCEITDDVFGRKTREIKTISTETGSKVGREASKTASNNKQAGETASHVGAAERGVTSD